MKISRAFMHRYLISDSKSCTCFPGRLPLTSSSLAMMLSTSISPMMSETNQYRRQTTDDWRMLTLVPLTGPDGQPERTVRTKAPALRGPLLRLPSNRCRVLSSSSLEPRCCCCCCCCLLLLRARVLRSRRPKGNDLLESQTFCRNLLPSCIENDPRWFHGFPSLRIHFYRPFRILHCYSKYCYQSLSE
jgi:hypothetical protein